MLKAESGEHYRDSLMVYGEDAGLGFGFDDLVDVAKKAGSAVVDFGSDVLDKTCDLVSNPTTQALAAGAAVIPSGASQTGAAAVAAANVACATFNTPDFPGPGPETQPLPGSTGLPRLSAQMLAPRNVATTAPKTRVIPSGSIAAFDPKIGRFRVAFPVARGLAGQLGADFVEAGTFDNPPPGVRVVELTEFAKETDQPKLVPFFKRPLVLGAIGVGVVGLGVGGYFLMRRR